MPLFPSLGIEKLHIYIYIYIYKDIYKDFFNLALHIFFGYVNLSRKWKVVQKLFYFDVHLLLYVARVEIFCWEFFDQCYTINMLVHRTVNFLWLVMFSETGFFFSISRKMRVIRSDCTLDWTWNWRRVLPCNGLQSELHRQGMCRDALYNWRSWHKLNWGQNRGMINGSLQAGHN